MSEWTPRKGQIVYNSVLQLRGRVISEIFDSSEGPYFFVEYIEDSPRGIKQGMTGGVWKSESFLVR